VDLEDPSAVPSTVNNSSEDQQEECSGMANQKEKSKKEPSILHGINLLLSSARPIDVDISNIQT
jgi:hypothetical protein